MPYLVFERIGQFGSLIIDPLERVHQKATNDRVKGLAAAALLHSGSHAGMETLLTTLEQAENPNLFVAVQALSKNGVLAATEPIENLILRWPLSDFTPLMTLVMALEELNHPFSKAVCEYLARVEPEWQREGFMRAIRRSTGTS